MPKGGSEVAVVTPEFQLMDGGPLYQWMKRHGMERVSMAQRAIALAAFAWVPLLGLAFAQGLALPGTLRIPFLYDIACHVRFLVVLPLLVLADIAVNSATGSSIRQFVTSGLVDATTRAPFDALIATARKRRDSQLVGVLIAALAIVPAVYLGAARSTTVFDGTWYTAPGGSGASLAANWSIFIGGFSFRILVYRWIWRLTIWTLLLWGIARLDLRSVATHPDGAGGLGFLGVAQTRFGVLSFAGGAAVSSFIADQILFQNGSVKSETVVIIAYIVAAMLLLLAPLLAMSARLARTRREGLFTYGALASEYVEQFDRRWVRREATPPNELLGSADVQSLADMANSFSVVTKMAPVPIDRGSIIFLAVAAAAPFVPLGLIDPAAREVARELLQKIL